MGWSSFSLRVELVGVIILTEGGTCGGGTCNTDNWWSSFSLRVELVGVELVILTTCEASLLIYWSVGSFCKEATDNKILATALGLEIVPRPSI